MTPTRCRNLALASIFSALIFRFLNLVRLGGSFIPSTRPVANFPVVNRGVLGVGVGVGDTSSFADGCVVVVVGLPQISRRQPCEVLRRALKAPFQGCRSIQVDSEDGSTWQILAGKEDVDNDRLSLEEGRSHEPWMHVAGVPGSHVVVRAISQGDKEGGRGDLVEAPQDVILKAAAVAGWYSKSRSSKNVKVHLTRCGLVGKRPGAPAGQVLLKGDFKILSVKPEDPQGWQSKPAAKSKVQKPKVKAWKSQNPEIERHKREKKIKKLERSIADLDTKITELDTQMADTGNDSTKTAELLEEKSRLEKDHAEKYAEWEAVLDESS
eukprot:TRINITY_DN7872_c1_g1_i6.p1 TRINITY_DN7872_c1_g1~~TRINITY_DN7872_c1_g1_i6.p1  ORF type:complete len:338 (+),score=61.68 TRINITY_DN7872_c1_g1_i6:43-1014(+)